MAGTLSFHAKLTTALMLSAIALAALYLSTPAEACSNVQAIGEIKIYNEKGTAELTSINFPQFQAGKPGTHLTWFLVQNTGKQPVCLSWSLSASSITWNPMPKQTGYVHLERGTIKYTLQILKPKAPMSPEQSATLLKTGESARLCFELSYSGKPSTAESFTMTITFTSTEPTKS